MRGPAQPAQHHEWTESHHNNNNTNNNEERSGCFLAPVEIPVLSLHRRPQTVPIAAVH